MLFICGGFYDSRKPIVKPLSNVVFMLRDHTNTRHCQDPRDNPGSPSAGMRLRQEELDRVPSMNCLAIYISTCGYAKTILREITISISYHLSSSE